MPFEAPTHEVTKNRKIQGLKYLDFGHYAGGCPMYGQALVFRQDKQDLQDERGGFAAKNLVHPVRNNGSSENQ
jgi:hypothetical protein